MLLSQIPKPNTNIKGWPWTEETSPDIYREHISWPKISIVTPSYNQGDFIEETIRSILLQNYPNLEFIVIDAASTDDTIDIIRRYSPWITHWESEEDRGQSHAVNKGIDKADRLLFNWVNSDDSLTKGALYRVAKAYNNNEEKNIFIGIATIITLGNENAQHEVSTSTLSDYESIGKFLANYNICQPATFLNLSAVKDVGALDESFHCMMDGELLGRIMFRYGLDSHAFINELICKVNRHADTKTVRLRANFFEENLRFRYSMLHSLDTSCLIETYNKKEINRTKEIMKFYLRLHEASYDRTGIKLLLTKGLFFPQYLKVRNFA